MYGSVTKKIYRKPFHFSIKKLFLIFTFLFYFSSEAQSWTYKKKKISTVLPYYYDEHDHRYLRFFLTMLSRCIYFIFFSQSTKILSSCQKKHSQRQKSIFTILFRGYCFCEHVSKLLFYEGLKEFLLENCRDKKVNVFPIT